MSLDKFGRSKHYVIDTTLLEKDIVENVKEKLVNSFGKDVAFIQDGVQQNLQLKFINLETNVKGINKRINENADNFQSIAKKFKSLEDTFVPEYNEKIRNIMGVADKISKNMEEHSLKLHDLEKVYNEIKYKVAKNESDLKILKPELKPGEPGDDVQAIKDKFGINK